MPPFPFKSSKTLHFPLFFFLITSLFLQISSSTPTSDLISDLQHLQSQSPTSVIRLTDTLLSRIISLPRPRPRPFSFLIFFDASQLHDKQELQLPTLKSEFSIVSSSFALNNKDLPSMATKLFFFDIEFKDSQRSFSLFGVNSLPHIRFVGPTIENLTDSDFMDQGDFSRLAESMAEFVESRSKISVGPIH